jgi:hypothetical protein
MEAASLPETAVIGNSGGETPLKAVRVFIGTWTSGSCIWCAVPVSSGPWLCFPATTDSSGCQGRRIGCASWS